MSPAWKHRYPITEVLPWMAMYRNGQIDLTSLQMRLYSIDNVVDPDIPHEVWRAILNAAEQLEVIHHTLDSNGEKAAAFDVVVSMEKLIRDSL
jgi:hypothetical protein